MDTAPRIETSRSGSSAEAYADAEYTEAPASDTTAFVNDSDGSAASSSAANLSVSREAVPLPIAISSTRCSVASRVSVASDSRHLRCGGCG